FRGGGPSPSLPERDRRRLAEQLDAALEPLLGAAIARSRAADVAEVYLSLDEVGRRRFFALLGERCGPDRATVDAAVGRYAAAAAHPDHAADLPDAEAALRVALVPGWERLFRAFCGLDDGVKFTVDLRADLLRARRV